MKRNNLWILLLLISMGSCGNKFAEQNSEEMSSKDFNESAAISQDAGISPLVSPEMTLKENTPLGTDDVSQQSASNIKIIKSGNISLESKKIEASKKNIDALLKKFNAYYEQESSNNNNDFTSYNLTIRIPTSSFDNFLIAMENGDDKVTDKKISAEDVSITYHDVESRLKSKRAYLLRYQEMVSSAKNVKDLLEIQEQIRQLQEEIDSKEAVLRNLTNQVNYSTLTVDLFEYQANLPMGSKSFFAKVKTSLEFGWNLIQNIALGIIGIWPVWIVVGLVVVIIRNFRRKRRMRKAD